VNPWTESDGYAREAAKVESAGEALLLTLLWWRRAGWTVIAQKPIEQYRIDLFVPEAGVAIEVDSFAGHGSNVAMEKDAKKRNLVVGREWVPLTFSARQTLFTPHDVLADILSTIGQKLAVKPRPELSARAMAGNTSDFAAGMRGLLSTLTDGPPEDAARLRRRQEFTGRDEREQLGVELLRLVLDYPMLLASPGVAPALATIRGPVGDAAAALGHRIVDGQIDVESFLRDCPAGLCGVAVESFAMPAWTRRFPLASDQVADVLARLAEIGSG
jgi:very-short-patch-repair endonuclease